MGPGVVSGAADNDPSGVITYIQIGATTGFSLLWLMLLSTPILYYLEDMSARLGTVGKCGVGRLLRRQYGIMVASVIVIPTLFSNVITVGADLSGAAAAVQLLTGIPWTYWVVPIAVALGALLMAASYQAVSRVLLILTPLFLLYIATGFVVHPRWENVLQATFLPRLALSPTYLSAALALYLTGVAIGTGSWLAGHDPLLVLVMAVFYGILLQGGSALQIAQIDPSLVRIIQAAVILFALAGLTLAARYRPRPLITDRA